MPSSGGRSRRLRCHGRRPRRVVASDAAGGKNRRRLVGDGALRRRGAGGFQDEGDHSTGDLADLADFWLVVTGTLVKCMG